MVNLPGKQGQSTPEAQVIQNWGGLNTKASRPGIGNEEFAWVMNFMPVGDQNMRVMYAEGDALYSVPNPLQDTIIFEFAYNIGNTSYQAVFLDDGTAYQVRRSDGAITTISAVPGTFYTTGGDLPHCAQWQSKYLIIVSTAQPDGYWIWNESALFTSGTLSPDVTVLDNGRDYSSVPTVTAYGGSGSGATFLATIGNNPEEGVTEIEVLTPGSGYDLNDVVALAISGGGSDDGAAATAVVDRTISGLSSIEVIDAGRNYDDSTVITLTGGGASTQATAVVASFSFSGFGVTSITVTNPGLGYTSAPTLGTAQSAPGAGLNMVAHLTPGQITSITVQAGGSGYTTPPVVEITGDGSGAEAVAVLTAGAVTSINVTNHGYGYSYASIRLVGGNKAASASVTLMPHGIKGNSVETFQSRVWVSDDTKGHFTAPASTSLFATSAGGGTYAATESFLRRIITRLIQANGFLYQIADSSINVISNVQTSGNPATTTFNNANIDPQVGCPWRDSVQAFGRALVFANSTGVYALYGGAAEKVSSALDGLFANATFNTGASGGVTPSAGVATIFGIRCYCLLFTSINPYTGEQETFLCCWDGQKWFAHAPLKTPTFIGTEEIDSELTTWATDGDDLFPLFQTPSEELEKIFQTKLRADPAYVYKKQVNRLYMMAESFDDEPPTFEIGIDTEEGLGALETVLIAGPASIVFVGSGAITFTGSGGEPIIFRPTGLGIYGYTVSSYGLLFGMTAKTSAPDCRVLSMTALYVPDYSMYA